MNRRNCSAGFQTCRIADFQIGRSYDVARPAGLETCDTADLEVCATVQLITGGGIEVNGERVSDFNRKITEADIRYDKFVQLQKGKKTHVLIVPV